MFVTNTPIRMKRVRIMDVKMVTSEMSKNHKKSNKKSVKTCQNCYETHFKIPQNSNRDYSAKNHFSFFSNAL